MTNTTVISVTLGILGAAVATSTALAQMPPGTAIVGTHHNVDLGLSGDPGLHIVDMVTGAVTPIAGLPIPLTASVPFFPNGAWTAALRQQDGAIAVGPLWVGSIDVYIFHLTGAAVDPNRSMTVHLGMSAQDGLGAVQVAALHDGRFFVTVSQQFPNGSVSPLSSGPMANANFAFIDTSSGTPVLTPIQVTGNPSNIPGGYAQDPTGRYLYRAGSSTFEPPTATSTVSRIDLQTLQSCTIATFPNEVILGVDVDDDGTVYACSLGLAGTKIHTLQTNGCNPAIIASVTCSSVTPAWALTFDRRSGQIVIGSTACPAPCDPTFNSALSLADLATGQLTLITAGPPGGWQAVSNNAVVVNDVMRSYGERSDSANRYWFANLPNAGGLPEVGNSGFSFTVASAPGVPTASALVFSGGQARIELLGATILIDPAGAFALPIPAMSSAQHALPIPNVNQLIGLQLFLQSAHMDANGLGTSRGLRFKVQ